MPCPRLIEHIRAGKLRALAVTTATRLEALPDIPTVGEFCAGLRGERLVRHRRSQEHAGRDRREAQHGDQCRPCRSQDQGAACRRGRHRACRLARPISAGSSPRKPRSGPRWSNLQASSRSNPGQYSMTYRYAQIMTTSSELPDHRAATDIAQRPNTVVTRADLIEAVYRRVGLSRTESAKLVELVLKEITDCLERGEPVKLSAFGSFVVRSKGPRIGAES